MPKTLETGGEIEGVRYYKRFIFAPCFLPNNQKSVLRQC